LASPGWPAVNMTRAPAAASAVGKVSAASVNTAASAAGSAWSTPTVEAGRGRDSAERQARATSPFDKIAGAAAAFASRAPFFVGCLLVVLTSVAR
jgi:hypothetical protein